MAGFGTPGSLCGTRIDPLDKGTLCLMRMPGPGPICRRADRPARLGQRRRWYLLSMPGGFSAALCAFGPDGLALLKLIETLRLKPYDDQTAAVTDRWVAGATIGYGHLIAQGDWSTYSSGITAAQADALLAADLVPFEQLVGRLVTAAVQQYQFDALVMLAFNIGPGGFKNS